MQPSTVIHFQKFLHKILMVESIFWSNNRLTVQSGNYILKWLHQLQKQPSTVIHFPKNTENTSGRVLLLTKLQTDCLEEWLHTKMIPPRIFFWKSSAWTVQKQLSTAIHFRKFFQKIPVVESFFWSNYRLAVQSSIIY